MTVIGERRDTLTVVRDGGLNQYGKSQLIVRCSACEREYSVLLSNWERGSTKLCRCRQCIQLSCYVERDGEEWFCDQHLRELRANPNGPWPGLSADFGVPRRRAQVALATGRRYTRREHRSSRPDTRTSSSVQEDERFLRMLLAEAEEHGIPAERVELLRRQMVAEAKSENVACYVARGGTVLDAEDEVLLVRLPDAIDELIAEAESDHEIRTEEEEEEEEEVTS